MTKKKSNDPWYGKVVAETGNVVSGGAGLLVRTKAMGGMSKIIEGVAKAAVEQATQAATKAFVQTQSPEVINFPNQKRRKK